MHNDNIAKMLHFDFLPARSETAMTRTCYELKAINATASKDILRGSCTLQIMEIQATAK